MSSHITITCASETDNSEGIYKYFIMASPVKKNGVRGEQGVNFTRTYFSEITVVIARSPGFSAVT